MPNGRPDLDRIPQLKRAAHRIYSKYDPDPDNALFQHCYIRDLMAQDFGEPCNGGEEADDQSEPRST